MTAPHLVAATAQEQLHRLIDQANDLHMQIENLQGLLAEFDDLSATAPPSHPVWAEWVDEVERQPTTQLHGVKIVWED